MEGALVEEANEVDEAQVKSLLASMTDSINEILSMLRAFVTSSCEKLAKLLSQISTHIENLSGKKIIDLVPAGDSILEEMKKLVPYMAAAEDFWAKFDNPEMKVVHQKLKSFLAMVQKLIDFSESTFQGAAGEVIKYCLLHSLRSDVTTI